jgi:phosphoribosyl-AMP cyclohydrolase / phosphoribosyl-ATP pyrophosphohydrolase
MTPDFDKYLDGLVPAIVQDVRTKTVLMLGFMNAEAFEKTRTSGQVTFFSRSRQRLWTKGETSGNYLIMKQMVLDCDNDTLLIIAQPQGPTCHTGAATCFGDANLPAHFLDQLDAIVASRKAAPALDSYTAKLLAKGINKVAQKVGEEAVELVIEAKDNNADLFLGEAADLLFHYLVLLHAKNFTLADVVAVLQQRHQRVG